MRESPFAETVGLLFRRLGLGAPRFDNTGIVRLRVEAAGVNLTDNGNGRLVIEAQAGALPEAATARAAAVRQILRTAAGMLLSNEAGVFVRQIAGGRDVLTVRASYAYVSNDLDRLVSKIEDVIHLVEIHAAALSAGSRKPARVERLDPVSEGAVIFRP